MPWHLNKRDLKDSDSGKYGLRLYVVSEELEISIQLQTSVGYFGEVDLMTARPKAIKEAKGLVSRFINKDIPSYEIIRKVVGERAFPNPVVI